MVKASVQQPAHRIKYNDERRAKRQLVKLEKQSAIEAKKKVQPAYRETYNDKRRAKALELRLKPANRVPATAEQIEAKAAFNFQARIKYNMCPLE